MKPDFFDEIKDDVDTLEEEYRDDSDTISCQNRYLFVFELFSEDEICTCGKYREYNRIAEHMIRFANNVNVLNIGKSLKAVTYNSLDKQHVLKFHIHIKKIVRKLAFTTHKYNIDSKRFYILDANEGLRLFSALKIGKKSIEEELDDVLNRIESKLFPDNSDKVSEKAVYNRIKEQVYKEKSTITVQNLNSTIQEIPQEAKELVNQVAADDELINSSWDITIRLNDQNSFYRWFNFLLSQITVYLVREEEMPTMIEYFKSKELSDDEIDSIIPQVTNSKALGCYYPMSRIIENKKIQIIICPELIEQTAKSMGIDKNVAYAKVIIHEFAHAVMDERNIISREKSHYDEDVIKLAKGPGNKINFYNPLFEFVMEESIANYLTLLKFQTSTSSIQKDVYRFIDNQPEAYRFGIKQFDAHVKACKWRTMKDIITPEKAQEWLDKYFINNEPYSFEAFDNLFK